MSQIAYVGHDGRIYLTDDSLNGVAPFSPSDYACSWPTWSPDGVSIAYSAMRTGSDGVPLLGVFSRQIGDITPKFVYLNDSGTGVIAPSTPHYLNWSPDSNRLAIIAQTGQGGLSLFVHNVSESKQPDAVLNGGPLYFSWSHDSRFLLIHAFQTHYMVDMADEEPQPKPIPGVSSLYMAPSWSSNARLMAICRDIGSNRQTLMIGDVTSGRVRAAAQVEGSMSVGWSPDGSAIAFVKDLNRRTGYYSGLWLSDVASLEYRQVSEDPILSFFWSPDGDKIAYITPSDGAEGSIRWAVLNVDSKQISYLSDFRPSQEQLITFMFFDQYSQSYTPWSAASDRLVFCGALGYQIIRSELPAGEQNRVFLQDVAGKEAPVEAASGTFAVFSPITE